MTGKKQITCPNKSGHSGRARHAGKVSTQTGSQAEDSATEAKTGASVFLGRRELIVVADAPGIDRQPATAKWRLSTRGVEVTKRNTFCDDKVLGLPTRRNKGGTPRKAK